MAKSLRSRLRRLLSREGSAEKELLRAQRRRVAPWFAAHGDETLRLDYDLGPESTVVDLGGYKGQWASDIYARYQSRILVFEPVTRFFDEIERRFERNERIAAYKFGLGGIDAKVRIGLEADATSMFKTEGETEEIEIRKAATFLESKSIQDIDLIKINIEGAEYDLLDHLLDSRWTERIGNLQIQFHAFVENAEERMRAIQERLNKTHELTYQYEFVWENWKLRT